MSVSVPENEIVCYNIDNAITNAKVRMKRPLLKKVRGPEPPTSDATEYNVFQ